MFSIFNDHCWHRYRLSPHRISNGSNDNEPSKPIAETVYGARSSHAQAYRQVRDAFMEIDQIIENHQKQIFSVIANPSKPENAQHRNPNALEDNVLRKDFIPSTSSSTKLLDASLIRQKIQDLFELVNFPAVILNQLEVSIQDDEQSDEQSPAASTEKSISTPRTTKSKQSLGKPLDAIRKKRTIGGQIRWTGSRVDHVVYGVISRLRQVLEGSDSGVELSSGPDGEVEGNSPKEDDPPRERALWMVLLDDLDETNRPLADDDRYAENREHASPSSSSPSELNPTSTSTQSRSDRYRQCLQMPCHRFLLELGLIPYSSSCYPDMSKAVDSNGLEDEVCEQVATASQVESMAGPPFTIHEQSRKRPLEDESDTISTVKRRRLNPATQLDHNVGCTSQRMIPDHIILACLHRWCERATTVQPRRTKLINRIDKLWAGSEPPWRSSIPSLFGQEYVDELDENKLEMLGQLAGTVPFSMGLKIIQEWSDARDSSQGKKNGGSIRALIAKIRALAADRRSPASSPQGLATAQVGSIANATYSLGLGDEGFENLPPRDTVCVFDAKTASTRILTASEVPNHAPFIQVEWEETGILLDLGQIACTSSHLRERLDKWFRSQVQESTTPDTSCFREIKIDEGGYDLNWFDTDIPIVLVVSNRSELVKAHDESNQMEALEQLLVNDPLRNEMCQFTPSDVNVEERSSLEPIGQLIERQRQSPITGTLNFTPSVSTALKQSSDVRFQSMLTREQAFDHFVKGLSPPLAPHEPAAARTVWNQIRADVHGLNERRETLHRHVSQAFPIKKRSFVGATTLISDVLELHGRIVHLQAGLALFAVKLKSRERQFKLIKAGDFLAIPPNTICSWYYLTDTLIVSERWSGWQFLSMICRAWKNDQSAPASPLLSPARKEQLATDRLAFVIDHAISAMYALFDRTLLETIAPRHRDGILLAVKELTLLRELRKSQPMLSWSGTTEDTVNRSVLIYWLQVVLKPLLSHHVKSI